MKLFYYGNKFKIKIQDFFLCGGGDGGGGLVGGWVSGWGCCWSK